MADPRDTLSKDLTVEEFGRFRDFINDQSGIYLEKNKLDSLRISLVARATRLDFTSYDEYYRLLVTDDREFRELLNLITVNETFFFRFPQQFEVFRERVIPEILEGKPAGSGVFRAWSAGCSTGEEAYSLAISLADSGIEGLGWKPSVVGTDVSTNALTTAREGVYEGRSIQGVPAEVLSRHFTTTADGMSVGEDARRLVDFAYHNLIKEPYPLHLMGSWDVVFCRNVTIYFRLESIRRVVSNFFSGLNEGGYLFIGHSETLASISDEFEPVEVDDVFLYRKPRRRSSMPVSGPVEPTSKRRRSRTSGRGEGVASSPVPDRPPDSAPVRDERPVSIPSSSESQPVEGDPVAEARALIGEGRIAEAREVLGRVLEGDSGNADAHLLLAFSHADSGDYESALEDASRALEIDPLMASARYVLGVISQRRGEVDRAVAELKKTIYIDSDFVLAHLNLGNIYKGQAEWDAACRSYENALASLEAGSDGEWTEFMGGFRVDLLATTCERSLIECRKAMGVTLHPGTRRENG